MICEQYLATGNSEARGGWKGLPGGDLSLVRRSWIRVGVLLPLQSGDLLRTNGCSPILSSPGKVRPCLPIDHSRTPYDRH